MRYFKCTKCNHLDGPNSQKWKIVIRKGCIRIQCQICKNITSIHTNLGFKQWIESVNYCYRCLKYKPHEEFSNHSMCSECWDKFDKNLRKMKKEPPTPIVMTPQKETIPIPIIDISKGEFVSPNEKLIEDGKGKKRKKTQEDIEDEYKLIEDVYGKFSGRIHTDGT